MEGIDPKEIIEVASEAAKYVDADRVGEIKLTMDAAVKEGLEKFKEVCNSAFKSCTDENERAIALDAYYYAILIYLYNAGVKDNVAHLTVNFVDDRPDEISLQET